MPLFGPRWPLKKGNNDVFELYDNVNDQISFYLKCLLLTSPGENISDPDYGVGLRRFLFEQNIESTRSQLSSRVTSQISKYLPYIEVQNIEVSATGPEIDEGSMKLRIVYFIPSNITQQVFELDLNPDTNIGFY